MLSHIHIWNFAIVEKLDIEFLPGLTVLTGETGAGKSILLDALGLALGDRADSSVVRHGSEKAEISVSFNTDSAQQAEQWLIDHDMQSEQECIIRRTISTNGPSKAFINGIPATVQQLRELGEMLVDLHGQHEHQSLMNRDIQRQLLDDYAGHAPLLGNVASTFSQWQQLKHELEQLQTANRDRDARLDLLSYQVNELEALDLQYGEITELEQEHKRLANSNQLLQSVQQILNGLEDNEEWSVNQTLGKTTQLVQGLVEFDDSLSSTAETLDTAAIQIEECVSDLRQYIDKLDLDPARLAEVEQRIGEIYSLARKHHCTADELVELFPQLQKELENLQQAEVRLGGLEKEINELKEQYENLANELSNKRHAQAKKLSTLITQAMQELSMEGGTFEITLERLPEGKFSSNGIDQIEFRVSANPGQPVKPLTKVASGGELSRISLAIQVIAAKATRIPTLIFDEVDVGIGGRVAEIVGMQLRKLAAHRQVVCVTHLPQVAALGHHHFQVRKHAQDDATLTQIQILNDKQRVDEVARMLGGIEITDQTLSHAKEMIERAQI